MSSILHNVCIACSNLVALYFANYLFGQNEFRFYRFEYLPMLASFFYHMAETKNRLPGIHPFNGCTHQLLNLDRIFAVFSAVAILFLLKTITVKLIVISIFAFSALLFSEYDVMLSFLENIQWNDPKTYVVDYEKVKPMPKIPFVISHSIWHILAFYILSAVINQ